MPRAAASRRGTCTGSSWRSTAATADRLGARRHRGSAAREHAPDQRHLGVAFRRHRRGAHHRVLRVARDLRVRHERQARSGRSDFGDKTMRSSSAKARRRRSTATTSSSSGIIRASRSSSRSTSAPARSSGACRATEIDTWSTPLIVEHDGRAQVITSGRSQVRSYDLETGKVVWHTSGLTTLNRFRRRSRTTGWSSDERVQRQQPEGDPSSRRARRHHRHAARSRGRSTATRPTCPLRFSTTACCTC